MSEERTRMIMLSDDEDYEEVAPSMIEVRLVTGQVRYPHVAASKTNQYQAFTSGGVVEVEGTVDEDQLKAHCFWRPADAPPGSITHEIGLWKDKPPGSYRIHSENYRAPTRAIGGFVKHETWMMPRGTILKFFSVVYERGQIIKGGSLYVDIDDRGEICVLNGPKLFSSRGLMTFTGRVVERDEAVKREFFQRSAFTQTYGRDIAVNDECETTDAPKVDTMENGTRIRALKRMIVVISQIETYCWEVRVYGSITAMAQCRGDVDWPRTYHSPMAAQLDVDTWAGRHQLTYGDGWHEVWNNQLTSALHN